MNNTVKTIAHIPNVDKLFLTPGNKFCPAEFPVMIVLTANKVEGQICMHEV